MDKLSSAVAKKLKGKKTNTNNNSGGESFEQLVKDATQKHLKTPDSLLNQKVVSRSNHACCSEGAVVGEASDPRPEEHGRTYSLLLHASSRVFLFREFCHHHSARDGRERCTKIV